jgi:hypothetical protein
MFKFIYARHKIHPKIEEYYEQWYLLLDTIENFNQFILSRSNRLNNRYAKLHKEQEESTLRVFRSGHMSDEDDQLIVNRLALDDTRKNIIDDALILDEFLQGYIKCFKDKGHIIVSPNNSFRFMDDSFQILDTKISEKLRFPATSERDIIVKQWEGGKHWYVRVGNYDLPDKYFSYESGLKAGQQYLKESLVIK